MTTSSGTIALEGTDPRGKQPSRINPYWALVVPLVLFLVVIYLYPIGQVLWISFSDPEVGFQNYERLVTNRGILRMLGNTFRICYDLSGAKRPTEFKTTAGTKLYLVTYNRKK